MASIIVISGLNKGDYYPLGQRTNVIGRDEALPIQILDPKVSRKHMQIRYDSDKDQYCAIDMKSKHGVFINDRRVNEETVLGNNDCIIIGKTSMLFTFEDFTDRDNALNHFKKVGERRHPTLTIGDSQLQ